MPARIDLDEPLVISAYLDGKSEQALAIENRVDRSAVKRILLKHGVKRRGISESQKVRMSRMTREERLKITEAAHEAARGREHSREEKIKRATTVERLGWAKSSATELAVRAWLEETGLMMNPQTRVGPYNCDMTVEPVAVEIWGGNWHFSGRHALRTEERIREIGSAGWLQVIVHINERFPFLPAGRDAVVAAVKQARCDPSLIGQYRMIRGNGDLVAVGRFDDDDIASKLSLDCA